MSESNSKCVPGFRGHVIRKGVKLRWEEIWVRIKMIARIQSTGQN